MAEDDALEKAAALREYLKDRAPVTDKMLLAKLNHQTTAGETVMDAATRGLGGVNKTLAQTAMLPLDFSAWLTGTQGKGFHGAAREALSPWLDQPEPETPLGRYAQATGEAIGGALPVAGALTRTAKALPMVAPMVPQSGVGAALREGLARPFVEDPARAAMTQIIASAGAGAAQQGAEDAGAGPIGQTAAGMAGGFAAGMPAARGLKLTRGPQAPGMVGPAPPADITPPPLSSAGPIRGLPVGPLPSVPPMAGLPPPAAPTPSAPPIVQQGLDMLRTIQGGSDFMRNLHLIPKIAMDPTGGALVAGKQALQFALGKIGIPTDAASVAERLMSNSPLVRNQAARDLEMRIGKTRFRALGDYMRQSMVGAAAGTEGAEGP